MKFLETSTDSALALSESLRVGFELPESFHIKIDWTRSKLSLNRIHLPGANMTGYRRNSMSRNSNRPQTITPSNSKFSAIVNICELKTLIKWTGTSNPSEYFWTLCNFRKNCHRMSIFQCAWESHLKSLHKSKIILHSDSVLNWHTQFQFHNHLSIPEFQYGNVVIIWSLCSFITFFPFGFNSNCIHIPLLSNSFQSQIHTHNNQRENVSTTMNQFHICDCNNFLCQTSITNSSVTQLCFAICGRVNSTYCRTQMIQIAYIRWPIHIVIRQDWSFMCFVSSLQGSVPVSFANYGHVEMTGSSRPSASIVRDRRPLFSANSRRPRRISTAMVERFAIGGTSGLRKMRIWSPSITEVPVHGRQ
jgi:hypothetical protein